MKIDDMCWIKDVFGHGIGHGIGCALTCNFVLRLFLYKFSGTILSSSIKQHNYFFVFCGTVLAL